jgi:DNA invertase Pin-like site-specific DNA recombinase
MPNADAPKQVILYTRVSGEEQKKRAIHSMISATL